MTGETCENCDGLIEGGTPFTRYCDDCITCNDCGGLLNANRVESYYTPALCDDCNLTRAMRQTILDALT